MDRRSWWFVGGGVVLFSLIIGSLQYVKFRDFGYNGLDLGIYTQTIWSLSQGYGFASSIHDPTYLGDHLELWLVPLAQLYRWWPSPLLILWAQTLLLASAAIPIALLARRLLGPRVAIWSAWLFLAHPLLYNAALYEFHGLSFALPILVWSIVAYHDRRYRWWLALLILLLFVREDMPLLVAGWALLAAIERRGSRWWLPPLVLAGLWWWAANTIIGQAQPLGHYKFLAFYRWLGDSYGQMITFPFRHPLVFLSHLFQVRNWLTTVGFLVAFGFLPLWRPRRLWPLLLVFLQLLLIGAEAESILRLHYVIPYLPFLIWATLEAVRDRHQLVGFVRFGRSVATTLVTIVAVSGPLYAHLLFGPAEWPWKPRSDQGLTEPAVLGTFLPAIKAGDRVLTTFNLLPHLANRSTIYSLNYVHLGRRQYSEVPYRLPGPIDVALIDWQQYYHYQFLYQRTFYRGLTGPQRFERLLADQGLRLAAWVDSVALYARDGRDAFQPTAKLAVGETEISGDRIRLLRPPQVTGLTNSPFHQPGRKGFLVELAWQNGRKLSRPLSIRFRLSRGDRVVWSSTRLLGQGTPPSNEWRAGEAWLTRHRLVTPKNVRGRLHLTAEVVALEGRVRLNRWRQFTPVISQERVYDRVPIGSIEL
ncbi:MAG: DUF2079 domain-containing protein [Candidatus Kerfeldbacteria bacterium]|nr:DUF2079 domain-containing protein [Candidatus Kerfeldbacteria bacterium]